MRRKTKNILEALAILITLLVCASFLSNTSNPKVGQPPDFYPISREVSFNEFIEEAYKANVSVYLPSDLPNNLELVAIYLKEASFIAIVVYSAEGNKDYKTAELTIEIAPLTSPPTYEELVSQVEDSPYETALEINGWPVLVNEKASTGGNEETREKYGDYLLLVIVWIDGMRYMISCPTLSTNESVQLVGNNRLLTP
jgi:hypothetical protein